MEDQKLKTDHPKEVGNLAKQIKDLQFRHERPDFLNQISERITLTESELESFDPNLGMVPEFYKKRWENFSELLEKKSLTDAFDIEKYPNRNFGRFPNGSYFFAEKRIQDEAETKQERLTLLAHYPLLKNWLLQFQIAPENLNTVLEIMALPEYLEALETTFKERIKVEKDSMKIISPKRVFDAYEKVLKIILKDQDTWKQFQSDWYNFRRTHGVRNLYVSNFAAPFRLKDDALKNYHGLENLYLNAFFKQHTNLYQRINSIEENINTASLWDITRKRDLIEDPHVLNLEFPSEDSDLLNTGDSEFYNFEYIESNNFIDEKRANETFKISATDLRKKVALKLLLENNYLMMNKMIFANSLLSDKKSETRISVEKQHERQFEVEDENYFINHTLRGTFLEKNLNRFLIKDQFVDLIDVEFVLLALNHILQNTDLYYNRKFVKGIMLHLFHSKNKIKKENLDPLFELFLKIVQKRESPIILIETTYFAMKNGYKFSRNLLKSILKTLSDYPHLRLESLDLAMDICEAQNFILHFEDLSRVLEQSCAYHQFSLFDQIYNKIRFYLSSIRYIYDSDKEPEQNKIAEEEFKLQIENIKAEWLSGLFDIVVRYKITEKQEILYQELKVNENLRSPRDLVNVLEISLGNKLLFREVYSEILSDLVFEEFDPILVEIEKIERRRNLSETEQTNLDELKEVFFKSHGVSYDEYKNQKTKNTAAPEDAVKQEKSENPSGQQNESESKTESKAEGDSEKTQETVAKDSKPAKEAAPVASNPNLEISNEKQVRRKKDFRINDNLAARIFPMLLKHKEFLGYRLMRLYWLFVGRSDFARNPEVVREMLIYFEWLREPLKFERYLMQFEQTGLTLNETNFRLAFRLVRSIEDDTIRHPLMDLLESFGGRQVASDKIKVPQIIDVDLNEEDFNSDFSDEELEEFIDNFDFDKMVDENSKWIFENFKSEYHMHSRSYKDIPEKRKGKGSKFGRETQKKYLSRLFARITYSDQPEGIEEMPSFV